MTTLGKEFGALIDDVIESKVLDDVYSGIEPMPSPEGFLEEQLKNAFNQIAEVVAFRRGLAMSGAMRWPWSQEACFEGRFEVWIK